MTIAVRRLVLAGAALPLAAAGCVRHAATFPEGSRAAPALESAALPSALTPLDSAMGARVYLPPGYNAADPDTRYPVVYLLHGYGGDQNTLVDIGVAHLADALIRRGEIVPMILVFPRLGRGFPGGGTSFFVDSAFGLYESWFFDVLMPYIGRTYNVDETRVGVSGHSMGGYAAMRLALESPGTFVSVAAHSAPLHLETLLEPALLARLAAENSSGNPPGVVFDSRIDTTRLGGGRPLTTLEVSLAAAFASVTAPGEDTAAWGQDLTVDPFAHDPYRYPVSLVQPDLWRGFHFPFRLNADGAGTPALVDAVWARFLANDASTRLAQLAADDGGAYALFRGLRIYVDCGIYDDADPTDDGLGYDMIAQCDAFDAQLTTLGIAHTYLRYQGTHASRLYYVMDDDLRGQSAAFGGPPAGAGAVGGASSAIMGGGAQPRVAAPSARAAATVRRSPSARSTAGR